MTPAALERAYFTPPEDSCGDVDCDDDPCACRERQQDARDDAAIDAEQARREAIALDGPGPRWEP